MLTDFSVENGGTWILPSSHLIDQNSSDGEMNEVDRDGALMGEIPVEDGQVMICCMTAGCACSCRQSQPKSESGSWCAMRPGGSLKPGAVRRIPTC